MTPSIPLALLAAFLALALLPAPAAATVATPRLETIAPGRKIWDATRVPDRPRGRLELTDLIRFRDNWYCSFHEGEIHGNHPSGRVRIIRSPNGENWETVALFAWDSADVREVNFSITAEGHLMASTSLYFVRKTPRPDGRWHQLDSAVGQPHDESEHGVVRQSVTWLSPDGTNWSTAYACPTGINTWRWSVAWYQGMGYSVAHPGAGGKDKPGGALYRTRDGKSWRLLKDNFFPGEGNEAALDFGLDGRATCLLRTGSDSILLGAGQPPSYQAWEWKKVRLDWQNDGRLQPVKEVIPSSLGGPKLLRLRDGRLVGAGRAGGISLFLINPETAVMTRFAVISGTSYAGIAEHQGALWVSHGDGSASGIYLTRIKLPPVVAPPPTPEETAAITEAASQVRLLPPGHLVFVGDSLTAGLPAVNYVALIRAALRERFGEGVHVTNAGVNGDTITRVQARLAKDVLELSPRPTHVFLFLGHNDSKLSWASGYEAPMVSPADYETQFRDVIARIRTSLGARVTVVSATSSVYELTRAIADAKARTATDHNLFGQPAALERFNAVARRVAAEGGADYLDVYEPTRRHPHKPDLFKPDGVHVNEQGNRLLAIEILRHLGKP